MTQSLLSITSIFAFVIMSASVYGQTINAEDATGCIQASDVISNPVSDGGSPARNIYAFIAGDGNNPLRVIWANGQWEIQGDLDANGSYEELIHRNSTFASAPNPPMLGSGVWIDVLGCGDLIKFEGTGTQSVLPVELVKFDAKPKTGTVELSWQTASEINNQGFQVERSTDGMRWVEISFVAGHGTTNVQQHYSFLDKKPLPGINYYRLRQMDFDGGEEYSKIVSVKLGKAELPALEVFPNPVNGDELSLHLPDDAVEPMYVQLFSPLGQLIRTVAVNGGINTLDLSGLSAGVYCLQLTQGKENTVTKILVEGR